MKPFLRGFGYADLENRVPAKPESSYRIASITKTITAVAVLQLAEAGKINLDSQIQINSSGCLVNDFSLDNIAGFQRFY
jgi:CubicO group peptidase (beta-lactamase class C family)